MSDQPKPLVIAHRGASSYAPENTMEAFRLAWKMDADGVEGDFHLTNDEQLICVHDPVVYDEDGHSYKIIEHSYQFFLGKVFFLHRGGKRIRVQLCGLKDMLDELPAGKLLVVEIKTGIENVMPLLRTIRESCVSLDQVQVIAFDSDFICSLKKAEPRLSALWIVDFSCDKEGRWSPQWKDVCRKIKTIRADGLSSNCHEKIEQEQRNLLSEENWFYNVWTVDQEREAKLFIELEASSISTNKPDWLREFITSS